jgi:CelD/BcsL family acetyltransferase involved in cellulose biosynthesis
MSTAAQPTVTASAPAPTPARPTSAPSALVRLELDDPRWSAFVAGRRDALPVHQPQWARLLADCYRFDAFALAALDDAGTVSAGLPVIATGGRLRGPAWTSLPFSDYCPPLLRAGIDGALLAPMLERARREGGVRTLELRSELAGMPAPAAVGYRHVLELSADPAQAFATFHHSQIRRAIRKAERDGEVSVRTATTGAELWDVFYRLHLETRRRHGTPIQPRRFFRLLWERMIEPGHGFVLLAHAGEQPIAGAVFLKAGHNLLYKYGASTPQAWRLRPNHLIFWSAIQRACAQGADFLDFGRTDLGHDSLRAFKASWGTREDELVYTRLSDSGVSGGGGAPGGLVASVIRRSPTLVCRVTGELLYRYAA